MANPYDNIWYPSNIVGEIYAGVFDFHKVYGLTNKYSRKYVSDHVPVYFNIVSMDENSGYVVPSDVIEQQPKQKTSSVLGNKNSKIYHLPHCKSFEQMKSSRNKVEFASESEAISLGYRKARNCN